MGAMTRLLGGQEGRGGAPGGLRLPSGRELVRLARTLVPFAVVAVLVTAACGGGSELRIANPEPGSAGSTLHREFPPGQAKEYRLPFRISGGFLPYESSIEGCPDWVTLLSDQGVLAGAAPYQDQGKSFFCTYRVTEADPEFRPQRSVSYGLRLSVGSIGDLTLGDPGAITLAVGELYNEPLPPARGGIPPHTYSFTCAGGELPSGMSFAPSPPVLAGTLGAPFRDSCTYKVTDSADPAESISRVVQVTSGAASPLRLPPSVVPENALRLRVGERVRVTFRKAEGGVPPYNYELRCALPPGLGFGARTPILSGTPQEVYRDQDCTYRVTDGATPPAVVSRSVALIVDPLDRGTWRFRTRSSPQSDHPVDRAETNPQVFVTLPFAVGGLAADQDDLVYRLRDVQRPLVFNPDSRELSYHHTGSDPLFDTPTTFRYEVYEDGDDDEADDALCVDVSYRDPPPRDERPSDGYLSTVRVTVRDDASWNGSEYRCPDASPGSASSSGASVSNPVHTALAPVHARRAVDVAHAAVRDRVRSWSRGDARELAIFAPAVNLASLSGGSAGFDYSGSSEAASAGAELGAGSWQAGLVASFVQTGLHYRAASDLAERGYRAGEHDTEFLSLHPFAAWHASSGGHVWASLGAGGGELRHRDDLGFQSWSRSDMRLLSYAAGASVPVADVLSGELHAEAGMEAFALEIEGGGSISTSLPTMRGRDYRAGLAWSAPLAGAPALSLAYRHRTGDGPEGGSLETLASVSVPQFLHPRLSLTGSAEASFGLGDYDRDLWGLGAGLRFEPGGFGRGFGLEVDTRFSSPAGERSPTDERSSAGKRSAVASIRGEAGYGLWGGPFFGTVRPYVGVIGHSDDRSVEQTLGLGLRETPDQAARIELRERPAIDRSLMFTFRHRQ